MPRILAPLKAPPASFGWFASIKPFGPAARLRFGFASTVAIKVGAFSTIKRSSWQPGFFASLFFGPKTPHPWTASPQFESHSATTHCVADGSPLAANRTAHSTLVLPLWWSGIEAIVRKCETRLCPVIFLFASES